ncbi:maestro heat-like repeat-containing protein family member 2A [Gallus gallus]|uniref:maestro heat-like repeat-containing protein family member 2A n=1 Tax=Gallus gallus TaxID=9031 RepID=UPI001AE3CF96|nr:maestro heat-like repeat-containing protein family member 2A [Gallus gallus]
MAASNVLVALARTHFTLVMAELQGHLKAVGEMSKEFVLVTLSKLFTSYAPQCISFVWLTLAGLRSVVSWVRGGRTLRIACAVVKQWLEGVKVHLCSGKQCPWPAMESERIYQNLSQLFCSVLRHWQDCKEEKDKQAVLGAVATMIGCPPARGAAPRAQPQYLPGGLRGSSICHPKDKFLAITSAVFYQLSDDTKEHSEADRAELTHCIPAAG